MRTLLLAMTVAYAVTPAFAAECYTNEDHPSWTIRVTEDGYRWDQGGKIVDVSESGTGTGNPMRVLVDEDGNVDRIMLHKGDLIIEMEVYTPGCR
ncbi:hypothetical protein GOD47_01400 [Sinorhizobium medicae]|nr:hypothetical protein [Sinorhizobium medicae]MDX0662674.1 hypothetical protein [Sinorhizobium medicae]MDX0723721.1 hypothetical protein [Sinorhizobium medicae]MDX0729799.1 hypothetical protein [Sinorhizobium medicae]MDX0809888.1 hypothetical protein [Sinorhizobium medicae]